MDRVRVSPDYKLGRDRTGVPYYGGNPGRCRVYVKGWDSKYSKSFTNVHVKTVIINLILDSEGDITKQILQLNSETLYLYLQKVYLSTCIT